MRSGGSRGEPAGAPNALDEVRCPSCRRLLCRWRAVAGRVELKCPRCGCGVVATVRADLPVARPAEPR